MNRGEIELLSGLVELLGRGGAGDTGYGAPFGQIRKRLGAPDVSLLPIGAYEPRWFMKDQHINPEEAVRAHLGLGSRLSLGMHFGTFRLTTRASTIP